MIDQPGNNDELIEYIKKFQPPKVDQAGIKSEDIYNIINPLF